jgi:hypothetical protein
MRKNLLSVGAIILAIGITMVGTSLFETDHMLSDLLNSAKGGDAMYAGQNGDYYSTILNVRAGDYVDIVSDVPHYLVPSGRLTIINSTNVETYGIAPSLVSGNRSLYVDLNGTYYVVVFWSSSPVVGYALIKSPGGFISEVALLGFGGVLAFVGLVVTIIGAALKPKMASRDAWR